MKHKRVVEIKETLPLYQLCNHLEAIATEHAAVMGISIEMLAERTLAWVLAKMHIKINRMPSEEAVSLYTWPVAISKAQFRRDFEITDQSGESIITAATEWVIVDLSTRRVTRIPDFVAKVHPVNAELSMDESNYKFAVPEDALALRITHANGDDIDINDHVNNVRYVKWIERALPEDIDIKSFEIVYKTEAFLGDKIVARGCFDGEDKKAFLVSLCREDKELVKSRINGWG